MSAPIRLCNKDIIRAALTFGSYKGRYYLFVVVDIAMGIVSQPLSTLGAARLCAYHQKYGRVLSIDRIADISKIEGCPLPLERDGVVVTQEDWVSFKKNEDVIIEHLINTGSIMEEERKERN